MAEPLHFYCIIVSYNNKFIEFEYFEVHIHCKHAHNNGTFWVDKKIAETLLMEDFNLQNLHSYTLLSMFC